MHKLSWFTAGVVTLAIVSCATLILSLKTQTAGFGARQQPSVIERWVAQRFRSLAVPESAKERRNPVPDSLENLAKARVHWADHCAGCHANKGSGDVEMGKHLYPPAPDMRQAPTRALTDGELLYIVQNGIRFTGMPAWGSGSAQDEDDSWKLVRFIRHLPKINSRRRAGNERFESEKPGRI